MREFDLEELKSATENFCSSSLIGKGSHGSVYKGVLKDGLQVAIKKQSLCLQKLQDNSKLKNEANILSILPPNPYTVNLLGDSRDENDSQIIVTEYMPKGTLYELLHLSTNPPPWPKRVDIALQIAKAVEFIHESNPTIIHRDIKSCNILVDNNWNAKLADFGLAVQLGNHETYNLPAGTIGYLDPEYVMPSQLSTKIDVFSYGVVLLELISGEKVIDVTRSPASIIDWAIPLVERSKAMRVCDDRVPLPRYMEGTIHNLLRIARSCVLPTKNRRPSISEIVTKMERGSVVLEAIRFPLMMLNCLRDAFVSVRRLKVSSGVCVDDDDLDTIHCNNTVSNKTLLVKEIFAEFPLK